MLASKNKTKKAARDLASLIQGHMDESKLSITQRERNVRALERGVAKIAGGRGKSVGQAGNVRAGVAAVSR
jgi:hypothetical protein